MAVAARGLRKDTFEERRYHHPSIEEDSTTNGHLKLQAFPVSSKHHPVDTQSFPQATPASTEIRIPSPTLSKQRTADGETISPNYFARSRGSSDKSTNAQPTSEDLESGPNTRNTLTKPKSSCPAPSPPTEKNHPIQPRNISRTSPLSLLNPLKSHKNHGPAGKEIQPLTAEIKKRHILGKSCRRTSRRNDDGESEDEIGVHGKVGGI